MHDFVLLFLICFKLGFSNCETFRFVLCVFGVFDSFSVALYRSNEKESVYKIY